MQRFRTARQFFPNHSLRGPDGGPWDNHDFSVQYFIDGAPVIFPSGKHCRRESCEIAIFSRLLGWLIFGQVVHQGHAFEN